MERDNNREPMLDMFIFETLQLSDQLEQLVLNSEKNNCFEAEAINEIFRIMHTIKGSAAMMLFNNLSVLAHAMEDLFYFLRETEHLEMDYTRLCDFVLDGIDFIKREISKIENNQSSDGDPAVLLARIHDYLATMKELHDGSSSSANESKQLQEDQRYYISSVIPPLSIPLSQENYFTARIFFEDGCEMENVRAFNIIHKLKKMAEVLHYFPADIIENNDCISTIKQNGFQIILSSNSSQDDLERFFLNMAFVESIELVLIDQARADFNGMESSPQLAAAPSYQEDVVSPLEKEIDTSNNVAKKPSIISVQLNKLDQLLDLVGELVISEAMVTGNPDLGGIGELERFNKAARQHRKVINELQDVVMSIRMVPLAGTFQKMNRIVRDMSKKINKQVEIEVRGEETEVDKNIIEHLSDPLMHLIRNAIDHGIETSEVRLARGKPASGKIILEGKNEGGDVWITIKDDGAGLNKEKILSRAREHGLINKPETDLNDQEIYSFILLPGFSTKTEVTEFSGRGVGMDVVAKNIEEIGG